MNKVIITGQLAQDPDMRHMPSGKAVCSFAVMVHYRTRVREEMEYIECVAWDTLAETIGGQLAPGRKVAVEGRLHVRQLEDENGKKCKVMEVVARDVEFMDNVKAASSR
ncbi:MAG: single-stranded DNA-binding protein [Veillonellales bacterium]